MSGVTISTDQSSFQAGTLIKGRVRVHLPPALGASLQTVSVRLKGTEKRSGSRRGAECVIIIEEKVIWTEGGGSSFARGADVMMTLPFEFCLTGGAPASIKVGHSMISYGLTASTKFRMAKKGLQAFHPIQITSGTSQLTGRAVRAPSDSSRKFAFRNHAGSRRRAGEVTVTMEGCEPGVGASHQARNILLYEPQQIATTKITVNNLTGASLHGGRLELVQIVCLHSTRRSYAGPNTYDAVKRRSHTIAVSKLHQSPTDSSNDYGFQKKGRVGSGKQASQLVSVLIPANLQSVYGRLLSVQYQLRLTVKLKRKRLVLFLPVFICSDLTSPDALDLASPPQRSVTTLNPLMDTAMASMRLAPRAMSLVSPLVPPVASSSPDRRPLVPPPPPSDADLVEAMICSICMDRHCNALFVPCSHMACCYECASSLSKCPLCRETPKDVIKVFHAQLS